MTPTLTIIMAAYNAGADPSFVETPYHDVSKGAGNVETFHETSWESIRQVVFEV